MKLKYFSLIISLFLNFHCYGMGGRQQTYIMEISVKKNELATEKLKDNVANMLKDSEKSFGISFGTTVRFNNTYTDMFHSTAIARSHHQTVPITSIQGQYQTHSHFLIESYKARLEHHESELRKSTSSEKLAAYHNRLKNELTRLELQYQKLLGELSLNVQSLISQGADPLQIALSTDKSFSEQKAFADAMMTLSSLKSEIANKTQFLQECYFKLEQSVMRDVQLMTDKIPTQELVAKHIPALKQEIQQQEKLLAQAQEKNRGIHQSNLLVAEMKLRYVQSIAQQRIAQEFAQKRLPDLKQLKETFADSFINDPRLVSELNKAIKAQGTQDFTTYNALRIPEKSLLDELQIPHDVFTCIQGDHLQNYLFNKTNSILYETALQNVQHKNSPELKLYIDATAQMCYVSMNAIKSGLPREAMAVVTYTKALHSCKDAAVNFACGVVHDPLNSAIGAAKGTATLAAYTVVGAAVGTAAVAAAPKLCVGAALASIGYLAYSIGTQCGAKKIAEIATNFQQLPIDKQAQYAIEGAGAIATVIKPQLASALTQNIQKIITREAAALAGLVKIENAQLATYKGVTFAAKYSEKLMPYIESGKIINQEDLIRHLEYLEAPFLKSFQTAVEYVYQKNGLPAQVVGDAGISAAANVKSAVEVGVNAGMQPSPVSNAQTVSEKLEAAIISKPGDQPQSTHSMQKIVKTIATPLNIESIKKLERISPEILEKAVRIAMQDVNGINHIFKKAQHNLDPLVAKLGGYENTFRAVLTACQGKIPAAGEFKDIPVEVAGFIVYLRGIVIDGMPRLGTFFIKLG